MSGRKKKWSNNALVLLLLAMLVSGGCAFVRTRDVEKPRPYDAYYGYSDLRSLRDKMVNSMLESALLNTGGKPPVVVVYGIENRTEEHIDTKAITDAIRTGLYKSGRVLFVNESRRADIEKEISYQKGNVTPETLRKMGIQLGAKYLLTGRLVSIDKEQLPQIRLTKKNLVYYKLTMELTDLKTSLIVWTDEAEIVKEQGRPLIGW